MLGDAIESSLGYMWYAGDVGCRIYRFFIVFNMLASNNLLVGMSIDRYCAVAIPMKYVRVGMIIFKCFTQQGPYFSQTFKERRKRCVV